MTAIGDVTGSETGKRLLSELGIGSSPQPDLPISALSANSHTVTEGGLFAALPGIHHHGADFAAEAIARGAAVILTDSRGQAIIQSQRQVTAPRIIAVDNPRAALAIAASRWFGRPPEIIAAVTGTNGKTSVASICQQIWQSKGHAACSFGTLGICGAWSGRLDHTTPDPVTLHARLAEAALHGVTHVAMEASSHGLSQRRLDAVPLSAAAFTNLTHDHLDYHGDFASYLAAKAGLFTRILPPDGIAVVCTGGDRGREIEEIVRARGQQLISVGEKASDLTLLDQTLHRSGQRIRFAYLQEKYEINLPLMGDFQAWNALTAAGLAIATGEEPGYVFTALSEIAPVRGRLQLAAIRENGAAVFVDYAHTPDGLRASLESLRRHYSGRLLVLFGAGGDRDRHKRPLMGQVACRHADQAIVTDDNPRGENPAEIRSAILQGCPDSLEVPDRAEAIVRAVALLEAGDVLLVAGKGHETGQEINEMILPFDDFEQASIAVRALDGEDA